MITESLLNKKLITEKRLGDTYKYTLTNEGEGAVSEMLKDKTWRKVAIMIKLGFTDDMINKFLDKEGK